MKVAADGRQGVGMAREMNPEIALVDIGLPDVGGYEVARGLRAARRCRFLVALTGYGESEDKQRSLEAGFDAHLVKPVDPKELARLLAESPISREIPGPESRG